MPTRFLDAFNLRHHPSSSRDSKSLKCRKSWTLGFITISYNILWTGKVTSLMNEHGNPRNFSNMPRMPLLASTPAILTGLPPKIYCVGGAVLHYPFLPSCHLRTRRQLPIRRLFHRQLDLAELDLRKGTYCHGHVVQVTMCEC